MKQFFILDEREIWHAPAIAAAERFGYQGARVKRGRDVALSFENQIIKWDEPGVGFIRPHADPKALEVNQEDYRLMCATGLTMIQDPKQVAFYEDKSAQWQTWGHWMPQTWRFTRKEDALHFAGSPYIPTVLVSKADEGASSENVRILSDHEALLRHINQVFDVGVSVNCCSGGASVVQNNYLLLQEFIPHQVTWRVNIVGSHLAGFMRYCYPNRQVAQTGNVEPIMEMSDQVDSLFNFARRFFNEAETNWCAADILWDQRNQKWRLLETSLAWPWPSPGDCDNAPFFGTDFRWRNMWDLMFNQIEAGVWHG